MSSCSPVPLRWLPSLAFDSLGVTQARCAVCILESHSSRDAVHVQEKEVLEAQKREQWVPRVGSNVYVPRMKGNFKVICGLAGAFSF